MTSPTSQRNKTTAPEYFPPVPDGVIPTQRKAVPAVDRPARGFGLGLDTIAAGVAVAAVAAAGAWALLGPFGSTATDSAAAPDSVLRQLVEPVDAAFAPSPWRVPDGSFAVGSQVQPGVYRTAGTFPLTSPAGCDWRVGDGAEASGPVLTEGTATGPATVTVRPEDRTFTSTGCQTWVKVD